MDWIYFASIVLDLLFWIYGFLLFVEFRHGLNAGILARMPGPAWTEHAHFILLWLIPIWYLDPDWRIVAITVKILIYIAYRDDYDQHWKRAHGQPNYTSLLHRTWWRLLPSCAKRWFL